MCTDVVCASCKCTDVVFEVVTDTDSVPDASGLESAVHVCSTWSEHMFKHTAELGRANFALSSEAAVPDLVVECAAVAEPVFVPKHVLECPAVPQLVLDHAVVAERVFVPDVVFERVSSPKHVFEHVAAVPKRLFERAAVPKRLFEHVSESKLVDKHVSRPKGVSELASKLVVPRLADKHVSKPVCVSEPVSEFVVLSAVFEHVSKPKCVSEHVPAPKLVFEHVHFSELVFVRAPVPEFVFVHASEPELVIDDASRAHDVWVARFSAARIWSQRKAIRKQRKELKRKRLHMRREFEHPHATVQGPCGSETAALLESVVFFPECCKPKHKSEHAVAAPTVEASGSESAALPVSVVFKSWKQESHGRWQGQQFGVSSCSCNPARTSVPAAQKRGATTGEASSSGRTVQSGSGSSRLPFAQPPAIAGGVAGGSLLALGLAALRAG